MDIPFVEDTKYFEIMDKNGIYSYFIDENELIIDKNQIMLYEYLQ